MPEETQLEEGSNEISPMVQALRDLRSKKEEVQSTEPEVKPTEEKPTEENKGEEKPEDRKPEEKEEDIDSLARRDGKPISPAAREQFKKLEKASKERQKKIEELEAKLNELKSKKPEPVNIQEHEAYKKLLEEKEEAKKRLDLIYFENSDEFKNEFIIPVARTMDSISEIFADLDNIDDVMPLINAMDSMVGKAENRNKYLKVVDKIAETMSPSVGARFAKSATELFELKEKQINAYKDKDSARREIFKKKEERVSTGVKGLDNALRAKLVAFEKTPVGKALLVDKDADFESQKTVSDGMKKAIQAVNDFVAGGVITPDLQEALTFGVVGEVHKKEREWLLKGFLSTSEENQNLKKENEDLKKTLSKLSAKPGGHSQSTEKSDETQSSGSALVDAIRSAKNR